MLPSHCSARSDLHSLPPLFRTSHCFWLMDGILFQQENNNPEAERGFTAQHADQVRCSAARLCRAYNGGGDVLCAYKKQTQILLSAFSWVRCSAAHGVLYTTDLQCSADDRCFVLQLQSAANGRDALHTLDFICRSVMICRLHCSAPVYSARL